MAEKDKKYYWLKLHRDFFKRHDIQIIEAMPNGKDYILFYLKLLCESVDHEGNLRFSEEIPYNEEMLSTITHTNIDVVRSGVKLFTELGMMEIMTDGTYFMREVHKMLGSETYWAKKKREQREKESPQIDYNTELLDNFQQMSNECPTCPSKSKSKSKSKSIETDIEKEIDGIPSDNQTDTKNGSLEQLYINLCPNLKPYQPSNYSTEVTALTKTVENGLLTFADVETAFKMANESKFLQSNAKKWAGFRWVIKPDNIRKILDGNYADIKKESDIYQHDYDADDIERQLLKGGRIGV